MVYVPDFLYVEEIKKLYLAAYQMKCKGITVFRYGSKPRQVLYLGKLKPENHLEYVKAPSEHTADCRNCSV